MVTTARVGPRWIDPDRAWAGRGRGPATPADEGAASEDHQIDRFHNHENMSPEALAQAVSQLQASLAIMTDRVAALEAAEGTTLDATRRLGLDVIELAGVLSRRVRALEHAPEPADAASPAVDIVAEIAPQAEAAPEVHEVLDLATEAQPPVEVADPAPPFLFVPQPAPRKQPAGRLAMVVGFGLAMILTIAAVAGGYWYYETQDRPAAHLRKPLAVAAQAKPVAPPPVVASPAASQAPRPSTPAPSHRTGSTKHETSESSDGAPTGHMLYGVNPTPAGGMTSSGSASTKP